MDTRTPEELLAGMTWSQKLAQLQILWRRDQDDALALARGGIGALFWPQSAERTNALQRAAIEESAHGIPLLIGLDVLHGQFTIFPTPLAQAASFDRSVPAADARISAAEARSGGVNWTFAPMLDVTRDPRWGRVVEGFGEDSFLAAALGAAKVAAYQGDDLTAADALAACVKHFVAYGAAEAGRDYNTTDVSRRRLRETYLEPFRSAVAAGAASVMAAFNSLNGTPMHAHRRLLTDVLKAEYGFEGVVVGDADGVAQLVRHGVARDEADAVHQSLAAGLDIVMGGPELAGDGVPLIERGAVDAARIDDAVLRVLRLKKALGLFQNPFADAAAERTAPTPQTLRTAQDAAERCVVLLKNQGAVLPLPAGTQRILLTGPYATSTDHLGAWVQHFGAQAGTLADALRAELPEATWTVASGAEFLGPSDADIREAVLLAAQSDLVLIAVGEPSSISGEAGSRADIRLPGDQEHLIQAIADTGVPFVVILITGRPLVVEAWIDRAPAALLAWHLGTRGPEAIARVVAGAVNPGGRVPMTFPRAAGQIPIHHDAENTGRPARTGGSMAVHRWDVGLQGPNNLDDYYTSKFLDLERGPRFAFGHGLSFTTFCLEAASLSTSKIPCTELRAGARVVVSASVRNVGERDGDDVVLVYLSDPVASLAQPVQRLRGFRRVAVAAGEAGAVSFELGVDDLGFWDDEDRFVLEPGELVLTVTDGTDAERLALNVTP
ncbi:MULTISPECIES: glycoside hydrolase family 3 N-terminal domain-containing protein [unclassified Microbacterium]|uniref:glycoside hydrolase family 3 N-terminal domain-containing protein n=1 Tax=unclassified Microbacterium TaxID=2609290 RepID=UPI00214B34FF|nr:MULTISPECIES: glycoside hydrolase family 3 N-terminal domain-containing protein [unclassified Microbacterium]MCR2808533.1 glycoside hydrolase family 3 C-terminal domain-containing protein [Microbacterium sp. zg.B185]WIM19027.1 glycoside hydrolase family 3 N-terminal domain-containing protein [Microbacterium sp. zg-B185]